jgi:hypothetical protein
MTDQAPESPPEETAVPESEETVSATPGDDGSEAGDGRTPLTGVPAVDEVLAEVDALGERPLDEHLATFERAHETLRAALDADPGAAVRDPEDGSGEPDPA